MVPLLPCPLLLLTLVVGCGFLEAKPTVKDATDLCYTAPPTPQDRRADKTRLRVVQYNAEWLFLGPTKDCPGSQCPWKDNATAIRHAEEVAKVLGALNADVVNLCEVEGCEELQFLEDRLKGYKHYLKKGSDSATGQNVGLLTRVDPMDDLARVTETVAYPVAGSQCRYNGKGGKKGSSKNYYTRLSLGGGPSSSPNISLISAHLLAYPQDKTRCVEREAQATVLRQIIEERIRKGDEVIFFGDLNDFDGQVLDANNNKPISHTLRILKGDEVSATITTTGNSHRHLKPQHKQEPQMVLQNVAALMVQSERYTDWYDKDHDCKEDPNELSMIDHILVTPGLYKKISGVTMDHSYQEFCGTLDSDHWPVVVDFDFS